MHLTEGDDVFDCIASECKRVNIQSGVVMSGIGSLRKVCYHYTNATTEKPQDDYVELDQVMELVSLQGIILECEPHLHFMLSSGGTHCHGGHVERGCEVQYLVEIAILEVPDMPLGRRSGKYGTVTHFERLD